MAVIAKTEKQIYEEYYIAGSILNVQKDGTEKCVLATSEIEAIDNNGDDALAAIIDLPTKKLDNDPDGSYTDNMVSVRVKAGTEALSPYIVTWKMPTTEGNKWETEMRVTIKELPTS